ncbi:hypothetical protein OHV05_31895 [Kitasatospora sp. NBC_00070]
MDRGRRELTLRQILAVDRGGPDQQARVTREGEGRAPVGAVGTVRVGRRA